MGKVIFRLIKSDLLGFITQSINGCKCNRIRHYYSPFGH